MHASTISTCTASMDCINEMGLLGGAGDDDDGDGIYYSGVETWVDLILFIVHKICIIPISIKSYTYTVIYV